MSAHHPGGREGGRWQENGKSSKPSCVDEARPAPPGPSRPGGPGAERRTSSRMSHWRVSLDT